MKCLICKKDFETTRGLSCHVKKAHDITIHEYKIKFDLLRKCLTCGCELSKNTRGDYCNKHRDRTGKNNSFFGKTHSKETINVIKLKCAIKSKENWKNKDYRNNVISGNTGLKRSETFKKEQSERVTKWFSENPKQKEIRSEHMKRSWAAGKIKPNINSINESEEEQELRDLCSEWFPDENVRKTTLNINGSWFYPDIRIGKNIIVEFYGDYWHANPKKYPINEVITYPGNRSVYPKEVHDTDKKRIDILKTEGFEVLIIWQSEFKDKELTKRRIVEFYNEKKN